MTIEEYLKNPKFGFSEAQIESIGKIADICGIVPMFEALVKKKATVSSKTLDDVRKEEAEKRGETQVGKQLREEKKKKKDKPVAKLKYEDDDDEVTDEVNFGSGLDLNDRKSFSAFQTDEDYQTSGDSEISDELSDLTDSEDMSAFDIDREDKYEEETEASISVDPVLKNVADDINKILYNGSGADYTGSEEQAADFVDSHIDNIVNTNIDNSKVALAKSAPGDNSKRQKFIEMISNDNFELTDADITDAKKVLVLESFDTKVKNGEMTPAQAAEAKKMVESGNSELFKTENARLDVKQAKLKAYSIVADKFITDLKAYYDKLSSDYSIENNGVIKSIQIIIDVFDDITGGSASDAVKLVNTADIATALGGTEGTSGTVGSSKDYMKNYTQSILRKKRGL